MAKGVVYFDSIGYNLLTYPSASINPEKLIPRQDVPTWTSNVSPSSRRVTDAELAGLRKLKGPVPSNPGNRQASGLQR